MEMLNNILKPFASAIVRPKPRYDSYALLILWPKGSLTTLHLVPEDPNIIEQVTSSIPHLPRSVSIQCREPLGNLTVQHTEGQWLMDVTKQLTELIRKVYNDDTVHAEDDAVPSNEIIDDKKKVLDRCERTLRHAFSTIVASQGDAKELYAVDLARLSRSKPGIIWDASTLTSFPH